MINQLLVVGRLNEEPQIETTESGAKKCIIKVKVIRSYKNADGEYDADIIPCTLWYGVAEQTAKYCKPGCLIGVRGRIQMTEDKMELIAEKISFLSEKAEEK